MNWPDLFDRAEEYEVTVTEVCETLADHRDDA